MIPREIEVEEYIENVLREEERAMQKNHRKKDIISNEETRIIKRNLRKFLMIIGMRLK